MNKALEQSIVERYSQRLKQFGDDPRTLGWDTRENQSRRFRALFDSLNPTDLDVLDIGCGFGDLLTAAEKAGRKPRSYLGIDINSDLLAVATSKHPKARFETRNLYSAPFLSPVCDVAYMCGVLNLKLQDPQNKLFSRTLIHAAFSASRRALAVDMLSARRDERYPAEDFVYYHDPTEMLSFAFELTPYACLKHDYSSIPQREFVLILRHEPEDA